MRTILPESISAPKSSEDWQLFPRPYEPADVKGMLESWNPETRIAAARELTRVPNSRTVQALSEALQLARRRNTLAELLRMLGWRWIKPRRAGERSERSAQAVWRKLRQLLSGPGKEREALTDALGAAGLDAVPVLLPLLRHRRAHLRATAINILKVIGDPNTVEPLCACLEDRDRTVRHSAAEALGSLRDPRALEPLLEAFRKVNFSGSARKQRILGWVRILCMAVVLIAALRFKALPIDAEVRRALFQASFTGLITCFTCNSTVHDYPGALLRAISAVTDAAEPTPGLHLVARELREAGADPFNSNREARRISVKAADRIETLVAQIKDLPVVSQAQGAKPEALPLPAVGSLRPQEDLPRPARQ